jgi:AcrR family transcriptional regulator
VATDSHVNEGPGRRVRRSAEAARRAILAGAERRLLEAGPEGLRLQEIAADVGLSHPAILHHFGSREGLVQALVEHTMREVLEALTRVARAPRVRRATPLDRTLAYLEETSRVTSRGGYARLLAWLAVSRRGVRPLADGTAAALPRAIHELRVRRRRAEGTHVPTFEDTLFVTVTIMFALVGESLFWRLLEGALGLPGDRGARARYLRWLARLVERYDPAPARGRTPRRRRAGRR